MVDDGEPKKRTNPGRRFTLFRLLGACLFLFWLTAIIVRLTVRDRLPHLSVLFYATPPVLLALSALLAGGFLFLRKSRRLAAAALLMGMICGGWWWQTTFFSHHDRPNDKTVRLFFWNCQRGRHDWKPIVQKIREVDAPLIGLVEAKAHTKARKRFWRGEFLDYDVAMPGGGIVLMTKGTIVRSRLLTLGNDSRCGEFRVSIDGRQLVVLVVDIQSNPFVSRKPAIDELLRLIDSHDGEPLLIVGDFNTPTDSYLLDALRNRCDNAFETAGNGNSATWPLPVPVLTLDQVWTGGSVRAASCRHLWTSVSDHRQVVTELSFAPLVRP